ncbi:MAG: lipid-A-disaccharide synthase [Halanaerobiales bacterium]
MGKIMVVAGEVSGDMHASRVVREIKNIASDIDFFGMGSDSLRSEGVRILIDPMEVSTIGFFEAFKNIRTHLYHLKILKQAIDTEKPDVIFLVDNSGFNMMMARAAYKKGICVVNYFSPSAWVWGKWRAKWMARYNATIASVFPMEARVYREAGAEVVFVGHPLVDIVSVPEKKEEIYSELEINPEKRVIALLPGSRNQEIEKLLPEMLKTAERIQKIRKEYQFLIPLAKGVDKNKISKMASEYNLIIKLVDNNTYEVMKISDLIIAASGTATLEAAIIGTPMVIIYKVGSLSYFLGKKLLKVDYIGLPNIIAEREVVPELIQDKADADHLYTAVMHLLSKSYDLGKLKTELNYIREKLGSSGAVKRTAELVLRKGGL